MSRHEDSADADDPGAVSQLRTSPNKPTGSLGLGTGRGLASSLPLCSLPLGLDGILDTRPSRLTLLALHSSQLAQ